MDSQTQGNLKLGRTRRAYAIFDRNMAKPTEFFDPDINRRLFSQIPPKHLEKMTLNLAFERLEQIVEQFDWALSIDINQPGLNLLVILCTSTHFKRTLYFVSLTLFPRQPCWGERVSWCVCVLD